MLKYESGSLLPYGTVVALYLILKWYQFIGKWIFHPHSGVPVDPNPDNLFAGSCRVHAGTLGILILSLRQNHISTD
jgi:hypothetical protein